MRLRRVTEGDHIEGASKDEGADQTVKGLDVVVIDFPSRSLVEEPVGDQPDQPQQAPGDASLIAP